MQSQNGQNDLSWYPRQAFNVTVIQAYAPTTDAEGEVNQFYKDLWDLLELTPKKKKDVFIIMRDWNAKVASQEILEVTGKFGLGVQNEVG